MQPLWYYCHSDKLTTAIVEIIYMKMTLHTSYFILPIGLWSIGRWFLSQNYGKSPPSGAMCTGSLPAAPHRLQNPKWLLGEVSTLNFCWISVLIQAVDRPNTDGLERRPIVPIWKWAKSYYTLFLKIIMIVMGLFQIVFVHIWEIYYSTFERFT